MSTAPHACQYRDLEGFLNTSILPRRFSVDKTFYSLLPAAVQQRHIAGNGRLRLVPNVRHRRQNADRVMRRQLMMRELLLLLLLEMVLSDDRRRRRLGRRRHVRHPVVLLPLHAPVLEPDLDLALGEAQLVRHLNAPATRQIPVEMELFLQLQCLMPCVRSPCSLAVDTVGAICR